MGADELDVDSLEPVGHRDDEPAAPGVAGILRARHAGALRLPGLRASTPEVRPSNSELRPSNSNLRPSNSELRPSNSELRPSNSNLRPSNSELRPSDFRVANFQLKFATFQLRVKTFQLKGSAFQLEGPTVQLQGPSVPREVPTSTATRRPGLKPARIHGIVRASVRQRTYPDTALPMTVASPAQLHPHRHHPSPALSTPVRAAGPGVHDPCATAC